MSFQKIAIIAFAQVALGAAIAVANPVAPSSAAPSRPAPSVTVGPEWVIAKPEGHAAIRLERRTPNGIESLSGEREICDCQPTQLAAMLALAFKEVSTIHVEIGATTICNQPATHFFLTGHGVPNGSASNLDRYYFRLGDSLYTLTTHFKAINQPQMRWRRFPPFAHLLRSRRR